MANALVTIERAEVYSHELAARLGDLLVNLSQKYDGGPVPEARLRSIIEAPSAEQILAISAGQVVGAATVSLRPSIAHEPRGWLEDFVVHPGWRGREFGTADKIADRWELWLAARGVKTLNFTSGYEKVAAHSFYARRGAKIIGRVGDSAFFDYQIPPLD